MKLELKTFVMTAAFLGILAATGCKTDTSEDTSPSDTNTDTTGETDTNTDTNTEQDETPFELDPNNSLSFDVSGPIMSYSEFPGMEGETEGSFDLIVDGVSIPVAVGPAWYETSSAISSTVLPGDEEYVRLRIESPQELVDDQTQEMYSVNVTIDRAVLQQTLDSDETSIVPAPYSAEAVVWKQSDFERSDGQLVGRLCMVGVADVSAGSHFELNKDETEGFAYGQKIRLTGELNLTSDIEAASAHSLDTYVNYNDQICLLMATNADQQWMLVDAEEYDRLLEDKIVDFDFDESLLDPRSENYLTFEYKDKLHSEEELLGGNFEYGKGGFLFGLDGEKHNMSARSLCGIIGETESDNKYVLINSRTFSEGDQADYSYYLTDMYFPSTALVDLSPGVNPVAVTDGIVGFFTKIQSKTADTGQIYKNEMVAVVDTTDTEGFIQIWSENGGTLDAGGTLQVIGNLNLKTEGLELEDYADYADSLIFCNNKAGEEIDCAVFDAL